MAVLRRRIDGRSIQLGYIVPGSMDVEYNSDQVPERTWAREGQGGEVLERRWAQFQNERRVRFDPRAS